MIALGGQTSMSEMIIGESRQAPGPLLPQSIASPAPLQLTIRTPNRITAHRLEHDPARLAGRHKRPLPAVGVHARNVLGMRRTPDPIPFDTALPTPGVQHGLHPQIPPKSRSRKRQPAPRAHLHLRRPPHVRTLLRVVFFPARRGLILSAASLKKRGSRWFTPGRRPSCRVGSVRALLSARRSRLRGLRRSEPRSPHPARPWAG